MEPYEYHTDRTRLVASEHSKKKCHIQQITAYNVVTPWAEIAASRPSPPLAAPSTRLVTGRRGRRDYSQSISYRQQLTPNTPHIQPPSKTDEMVSR